MEYVGQNDPIWSGACSEEECGRFKQLLLSKHDVFAMSNTELGETNLVEHTIDTGDAKCSKTTAICSSERTGRETN